MRFIACLASFLKAARSKTQPPALPRSTGFTCSVERAREILRAEGCWPVRPSWWPREEAESDYYAVCAFSDLNENQSLFEAAFQAWLR